MTREQFDHAAGPDGALFVGSPGTVAAKVVGVVTELGLSRFGLKYSAGTLPHERLLNSIDLYGRKLAPLVRAQLAAAAGAVPASGRPGADPPGGLGASRATQAGRGGSMPRTQAGRTRAGRRAPALWLALVLALAGCSTPAEDVGVSAPSDDPTTTSTSTSTTTTAPPPAPPIGVVPPPGLGEGDRGPQVAALEQWLTALRYDVVRVDDVFDADTTHAVIAFQKVANLPRTGRATQDVFDALPEAAPPAPLVPGGGPTASRSTYPARCCSSTRPTPSAVSCPSPPAAGSGSARAVTAARR
jgi:hypothetical protein